MKEVPPSPLFLMVMLSITTACHDVKNRKSANSDEFAGKAMNAVASFHVQVAQSRYLDLCKMSDQTAFSGTTDQPCSEFLAYVHGKLGDALETMRTDTPQVEDRPRGEAVRVELKYAPRYEHGLALEHFGWRIGGTQPILYSYKIEAKALK